MSGLRIVPHPQMGAGTRGFANNHDENLSFFADRRHAV
jgi:hypothetical protein